MDKQCKRCGRVRPLGEFYRHKAMADGYLSFCKCCVKARVTNYRNANLDETRKRESLRARNAKRRASIKRYREAHREQIAEQRRTRGGADREKRRAQSRVARALRSGQLQRTACLVCGAEKADAHHPDYSKPLEVVWLCRPHHMAVHRKYDPLTIAEVTNERAVP